VRPAAGQSAAANRGDDKRDRGQLLQDLLADRAPVAGHDQRVVVRGNEAGLTLGRQLAGVRLGLVVAGAVSHDLDTELGKLGAFDLGGAQVHHHAGLDAEALAGPADAQAVVAGRGGEDSAEALVRIE